MPLKNNIAACAINSMTDTTSESVFVTPEEAGKILAQGHMLIITDDENRENEGDFIMAAEHVTPDAVNFMITHGRGLLCISAEGAKIDALNLPMMTPRNTAKLGTPFTVSIDAVNNTTTGISAADRCETIRTFVRNDATEKDFAVPGHVFPLRAMPGGVLHRAGHTEAVIDFASIGGCKPIGVLCEILREDGSMARMPDLITIAQKHGLKICTIADLIAYRRRTESLVSHIVTTQLPTEFGTFALHLFESHIEKHHHLALVMGKVDDGEPVLVRVHSECLTGDALHSLRCDCGMQLSTAMQHIAEEKRGVIVYMRQEGRGIGLPAKLQAYHLQDCGADTVEANEKLGFAPDLREYGYGAQILSSLGIKKVHLLTNNPRKIVGLEGYGIDICSRVPLQMSPTAHNEKYLNAKAKKLGHML